MKSGSLRLVLTIGLGIVLLGWLSWLGWLARPSTTPREVLSPAQFMMSSLDVIAQVDADASGRPLGLVKVETVHWPVAERGTHAGRTLNVVNLAECRGWSEAGQYILPLRPLGTDYEVVSPPRSPGWSRVVPQIYPATAPNLRQLERLSKPNPSAG
jgi:hypothetical protein